MHNWGQLGRPTNLSGALRWETRNRWDSSCLDFGDCSAPDIALNGYLPRVKQIPDASFT
jgi:hypothetical protein